MLAICSHEDHIAQEAIFNFLKGLGITPRFVMGKKKSNFDSYDRIESVLNIFLHPFHNEVKFFATSFIGSFHLIELKEAL